MRKEETEQSPPDLGASRRQPSPAPGGRHQLASPRSTEHHRGRLGSPRPTESHPQSSRDRGTHAGTHSDLVSAAAWAKRAFKDAQETIRRRNARRRRHEDDIELAKNAAQETPLAMERTQRAVVLSAALAAARATVAPSPPVRPLGVASQKSRAGNDAFMKGSVEFMASSSRVEFSLKRWWTRSPPSSRVKDG